MATKETPLPGLLSKVAKFVRNPTTNWSDLDKLDAEPEQGYSKQALKEMIERKRQNDFVRRREFDHLRKLRNRDPSLGSPELAGRPSYFQSSLPSNPGERAMTIKKIDEIEAQMSNQWWQGKGSNSGKGGFSDSTPAPQGATGGAAPEPAKAVSSPSPPSAADPAYAPTKVASLPENNAYAPTRLAGVPDGPYAPTALAPVSDISYDATRLSPVGGEPQDPDPADFAPTQTNSAFGRMGGFSNSQSFAAAQVELVSDPELEEAAIRFANGDSGGAENSLLGALKESIQQDEHADSWTAALFDLYRATGEQDRFDRIAIDYAERSGRSAPGWFSIPDRLGLQEARASARTVPSRLSDEPVWRSPAIFDRGAVDELQLAIANAQQPWYLDWRPLQSVQPEAIDALGALVAQWCGTSVALRFAGVPALERALRAETISGKRQAGQAPWRLRLDTLRLMGLQDDFELVALDYCVTFEVSPPAWHAVRCSFERDAPASSDAAPSAPASLQDPMDDATMLASADGAGTPVAELVGEVVGEATDALERLDRARAGGDRLVISCTNLIRVDFAAAGSILNWVAARQSEGCRVQFRDVHRLVAAFFHVIGINEHAKVVLRST